MKSPDTGLIVSANSFLKGVVSVADLGTTLEEIELAKNQYTVGVVVEVTQGCQRVVRSLHAA